MYEIFQSTVQYYISSHVRFTSLSRFAARGCTSIRSKRYDFISCRGYFIDHNPYAAKAHAGMPESPLHHHFMCKDHLGISQYNALVVVELLGSTVLVSIGIRQYSSSQR